MKINPDVKRDLNVKKEVVSKVDQLPSDVKNLNLKDDVRKCPPAKTISFEEIRTATGNFRPDCFLGEGGFGKVHKGHLKSINQVALLILIQNNALLTAYLS